MECTVFVCLAVSLLGDRFLQRRQALQPLRRRADRLRSADLPRPHTCLRTLPRSQNRARDYYASAGIFDSSRTLSSKPNRNDGVVGGYVSPEVLVDLPTVALHIGTETFVRPSMDAWIVYGLGSEAEDLVGFVTINPVADTGGAMNYGSAFLPASFQRRRLSTTGGGVPDLSNGRLSDAQQRKQIEFIQKANRRLLAGDRGNPELEGIIQCYELAYKMQTSVPDVLDLDKEPQHIRDM